MRGGTGGGSALAQLPPASLRGAIPARAVRVTLSGFELSGAALAVVPACLCTLVVGYGLSINLTDVLWKSLVKRVAPSTSTCSTREKLQRGMRVEARQPMCCICRRVVVGGGEKGRGHGPPTCE